MEPRKHYFAKIPTIAIFIAFAISSPIGLGLFILKMIDKNLEKEEHARYGTPNTPPFPSAPRKSDAAPGVPPFRTTVDGAPVQKQDMPTAEQNNAKEGHKLLTLLCTILGAAFLFSGVADLADVLGSWFYTPDFGELITALAMTIGGGGALLSGIRMDRTYKLEKQLDKIVGDRDNIPLDELFAAAGVDEAKGRPAVKNAIEHGYFGADAYIDNRTATLIVRGAAPEPPKPEPAPSPAQPEDQYASLLRQLRQVNAAIPDPVMTAKIDRLEQLSARIFELAKKDPAKQAQLQKFMSYYLPTALKLLNTYAALPAQDVQGENITEAKQSIERSMDLLVTAFENQLDKLFQSDALDVSADVSALEGMLNLDGLTGSDFKA